LKFDFLGCVCVWLVVCVFGWLCAGVGVSRISFVLRTELGFIQYIILLLRIERKTKHKAALRL